MIAKLDTLNTNIPNHILTSSKNTYLFILAYKRVLRLNFLITEIDRLFMLFLQISCGTIP